MEKEFAVEIWGSVLGYSTEIFFTRKEAEQHFRMIRKQLDSSEWIITKDSMVNIEDDNNAVYLTDLRDL